MASSTFAFSSAALRSLRLEEELLERHKYRRWQSRALPRPSGPAPDSVERRGRQSRHLEPQVCGDPLVQNALYSGDLPKVSGYFSEDTPVNLTIETRGDELRWTSAKLGLWSLTYEQELTTPLHITASRGYTECLKHLLRRGANVEFAPGGQTSLQEACENAQTESVRLLLCFGANPNAVSDSGNTSLHYCKTPESLDCAKLLLQYGAHVNYPSEEEADTPLHVAARYGLDEHVKLFLRYGAVVDRKNDEQQTPLNAACSQPHRPQDIDQYYRVCKELIASCADIHTKDRDCQHPLHMACKNANSKVVDLLLELGSSVNIMCYNGNTAMQNILQNVSYKVDHRPENVVRSLLNYGAVRIWPGSLIKGYSKGLSGAGLPFHSHPRCDPKGSKDRRSRKYAQVLTYCCASPRTIEVLMNAYERVKVTEEWLEAVPPEIQEKHLEFFQSLFSLAQKPRSLQHLARCAIRRYLEGRLPRVVPRLQLPPILSEFLMLRFEDVLY